MPEPFLYLKHSCNRFLLKIKLGYPSPDEELDILSRLENQHPLDQITPVLDTAELLQLRAQVSSVYIDEAMKSYLVSIVQETRNDEFISLGVSPRGSIALLKAAKALALVNGRDYVLPDDIKYLAIPVLSHRLTLSTQARMSGVTTHEVLEKLINRIRVPVPKGGLLLREEEAKSH